MKDSLNNLFRERFQGHEAPVDPGTWAVIEAKLLTAPPAADGVNDLFRERFQGHEVPVDPAVWDGISSQLGHGATAGGGLLGGYGWLAAGVAGVLIAGAIALNLGGPALEQQPSQPMVESAAPARKVPIEEEAEALLAVPQEEAAEARTPVAVNARIDRSQAPSDPVAEAPGDAVETPLAMEPDAPAESPAVVEQIIQSMTEQARQEVGGNATPAPPAPAGQQRADEPENPQPDAPPAPKLFMPNTFTPNNDGINDTYVVPMDGFTSVMMRVYSIKNNQLVFATNTGEPWSGANCEEGMYLVAVEAITTDGRTVAEGKVVYLNRNSTN